MAGSSSLPVASRQKQDDTFRRAEQGGGEGERVTFDIIEGRKGLEVARLRLV
jgi:hypothetical protein